MPVITGTVFDKLLLNFYVSRIFISISVLLNKPIVRMSAEEMTGNLLPLITAIINKSLIESDLLIKGAQYLTHTHTHLHTHKFNKVYLYANVSPGIVTISSYHFHSFPFFFLNVTVASATNSNKPVMMYQ